MSTNHFFNNIGHPGEKQLHAELAQESIQINGIDVYYLPATKNDINAVLNEAPLRSFDNAYEIEVYIRDVQGFGGAGDFLTKFGIQVDDTCTVEVSRLSFLDLVIGRSQPLEGDLIYFPFSLGEMNLPGMAFEVHFVEDEDPFYQMQGSPVWILTTKLFSYSGERFRTGIFDIDKIEYDRAYALSITMDSGSGNYLVGENVNQPGTGFVAKVASWDATEKELELTSMTSNVDNSLSITGNTSGAVYSVSTFDPLSFPKDLLNDNIDFENSASDFVDEFNTDNPFGSW